MRRLAPLSLLLVLLVHPLAARAQSVANYGPVTRTTGNAYASISATGTSFTGWLNGTDTDDNRASASIGFTFHYMGNAYTQFNVSTNGFIDFSSSTVPGSGTGAYGHANPGFSTSGGTTLTALAPFYDQLTTSGSPGTLASLTASMKYLTSGVAPNRVLTVEWISMDLAAVANSALNFQIKLFESGTIQFNYSTMTAGSGTYSYTCGINGLSMDPVPTTAQLLTQQTANTATFSNTPQNGLTTLPLAGVRLAFVPAQNVTPAAPGPLSIASVEQTTMSVSFLDQSTTETFFRVQTSTDGVNFTTALTATSNSTPETFSVTYVRQLTGLTPGTVYTIRVTAENEASAPSTPVTIVQPTRPRGIYTVGTGYWSNATIWSGGVVPTAQDTVSILGGQQVAVNTTSFCKRLVMGDSTFSTGVLQWDPVTPTQLEVAGDVLIHPGSLLIGPVTGTQTAHTFRVQGDLKNNGTLNLSTNGNTAGVTLLFVPGTKTTVTFSGSGSTTNLRLMTVAKGAGINLIVSPSNLTVLGVNTDVAGFLSLSSGVVKFAGTYTLTNRLFTSAAYNINNQSEIWLANPNMTVVAQAASVTCAGHFHVTAGTYNVGTALNHSLRFSDGASATIGAGAVNVAGGFGVAAAANVFTFLISGGTLSAQTVGQNSTTLAGFDMGTSGLSSIAMSSGTVVLVHPSTAASGPRDFRGPSISLDTGVGTTQFGTSGAAAQTFFAAGALARLRVNSSAGGQTLRLIGPVDVANIVIVDTGATVDLNGQTLTVRGTGMTLNGTLTGNTPGSVLNMENHLVNEPATAARHDAAPGPARSLGTSTALLNGTGAFTVPLQKLRIDCPFDFTFGTGFSAPPVVETVELADGNVFNANVLTIGDGSAQQAVVGIGSFISLLQTAGADAVQSLPGGGFSAAPTFNIGSGGLKVSYGYLGEPRSTGFEIPPSRLIRDLSVAAGDRITVGGGDLQVTHDVILDPSDALVFTSADSMLVLGSNPGTFQYSTTSYVHGPLGRKIKGSFATRIFPIGDDDLRDLTLTNINTGTLEILYVAEVITPTSADAQTPLRRIDQTRAWHLTPDLPAGARVRLTFGPDDAVVDASVARVAQSVSARGPYHSLGGTALGSNTSGSITSTVNATAGEQFFTLGSESPLIRMIHPDGPTEYMIGQPTTLHWQTLDNVPVTGIDLAVSHTGVGGPFTTIATGVRDSTFGWIVTGPATPNARFRATLHDQLGTTISDVNDVDVPLINAAVDIEPVLSGELRLAPPAPNPAARSTRVRFELPRDCDVRLGVFDLEGRRIAVLAEGRYHAGRFDVPWDLHAAPAPTGLYLVRLETSLGRRVQRVVIMN